MRRIPAFARNAKGEYVYHAMKREDVADKHKVTDFKESGTRELTADDYVYAIRRLATPRVKSPSFSTMADYIVGLKEYGERSSRSTRRCGGTSRRPTATCPSSTSASTRSPAPRRSTATRCASA